MSIQVSSIKIIVVCGANIHWPSNKTFTHSCTGACGNFFIFFEFGSISASAALAGAAKQRT
jgi:hypothetical protein